MASCLSAQNGVEVFGAQATGNAILSNAIFSNNQADPNPSPEDFVPSPGGFVRGLGINLRVENSPQITANDPGDSDVGPNTLQNFPVLTSATFDRDDKRIKIKGTLNSIPSTLFILQFFGNIACHRSGNGEGEHFIGSMAVTTDSNGDAHFAFPFIPAAFDFFITATATDPANNTSEFSRCVGLDSDGDALLDRWELNGMDVNGVPVDLPAMGADPYHKDIFVEIDYMGEAADGHTHAPKPQAIERVISAFNSAPVDNPDGMPGIRLHVDFGANTVMNPLTGETWGMRSRSDVLPHDVKFGERFGCLAVVVDPIDHRPRTGLERELRSIQAARFSPERRFAFHYALFVHNRCDGTSSGASFRIPDSYFFISLADKDPITQEGTVCQQAGTFMHELGHNLGLDEGGGDNITFKPNYLSVMNYAFQLQGLRINGSDGHFDYSKFDMQDIPDLNELSLDESVGLSGTAAINGYGTYHYCAPPLQGEIIPQRVRRVENANGAIDWNCSQSPEDTVVPEPGTVSFNINQDHIDRDPTRPILGLLKTHNDWMNLVYNGGAIGGGGAAVDLPPQPLIDEPTAEEFARLTIPLAVAVARPKGVDLPPGASTTYTFRIINIGDSAETFTLGATSAQGWAALDTLPATVTLEPGEETDISISVTVPTTASEGETDRLTLEALSQTNPLMLDAVSVTTTVTAPDSLVPVPDVVGLSQAEAEAVLTAASLTVGNVTSEHSATVPAGDVLHQEPTAGSRVVAGSAVHLIVSLGAEPSIPGDLNGDRTVDCSDLAIVKAAFGKRSGQPGFDPRADTNSDGVVNVKDLAFVAQKLPAGTRCP